MSHSHVFISYSHKNRDKLDQLVEKLRVGGYSDDEIWYDNHITAGKDWRDEIEIKLGEAFAVLVIVTKRAMCSTYVTYEWSWALGNGTPVVPLLFENMLITKIHARLSKINYINCVNLVDDEVINALTNYRKLPPDTLYLDHEISNTVKDFRALSRVATWLYRYLDSGLVDNDLITQLMQRTSIEADQVSQKLLGLLVDKSHAFNSKQRRKCRELVDNLQQFSKLFQSPIHREVADMWYMKTNFENLDEIDRFRKVQLEPLIEYFLPEGTGHNYAYQALERCLHDITDNRRANDKDMGFLSTLIGTAIRNGNKSGDTIYVRNVTDTIISIRDNAIT